MTAVQEIERLYGDYLEHFHRQDSERKPGQGIFGMGAGPGDLPCHEQFLDNLGALLTNIADRGACSQEAREALEFIFSEPVQLQSEAPAAYWTLMATQGLGIRLAGRLSAEDAAALYGEYKSAYPRSRRMPAQECVLGALKKCAKRI